jgi:hypothetical protein
MHNNQYDEDVNVRCYQEPSMNKVKRNHWKEKGFNFVERMKGIYLY